jgi:thiamine biosynthesis lipoprotein
MASTALATRADLHAMSCPASIVATAAPMDLVDRGVRRIHELERRWSRFLDSSEISGLNRAAGAARRCSPDTIALVEGLVGAWHATDGSFDPTLLGSLVELGYAASRDDATHRTSLAPSVAPSGNPAGILVDAAAGVVQLPVGTSLDPGGLGKGLAADIIVGELLAGGATGALVEIGGDLRVAGHPPDGSGWCISIDHPLGGDRELVEVHDGGVATSTSRIRCWLAHGALHHHLLNPSTKRSTDDGVVGCTVIAGTAAWAEAFTKVAFVRGVDAAIEAYESHGLAARLVTDVGGVRSTTAWQEFRR